MKFFHLHCIVDEGHTVTAGNMAEGVLFASGKVAISWLYTHSTVSIFDDLATVETVLCDDGGMTTIKWEETE